MVWLKANLGQAMVERMLYNVSLCLCITCAMNLMHVRVHIRCGYTLQDLSAVSRKPHD